MAASELCAAGCFTWRGRECVSVSRMLIHASPTRCSDRFVYLNSTFAVLVRAKQVLRWGKLHAIIRDEGRCGCQAQSTTHAQNESRELAQHTQCAATQEYSR